MTFKTKLDKYLTTPPDDGADFYYEAVYEGLSKYHCLKYFDFDKHEKILDEVIDGCFCSYHPEISPDECIKVLSLMLSLDLVKGIDYDWNEEERKAVHK